MKLCPKCGADQDVLTDSLKQQNMNYDLACLIVENCRICKRALGRLIHPEIMTVDQFLKLDTMPEYKVKVVE